MLHELADRASGQRLDVRVPAVLGGVQRAMPLDDPAVVAGLGLAQDGRRRRWRVAEKLANGGHRRHEAALLALAEPADHLADLLGRAAVEHRELGPAQIGELHQLPTGVAGRAPAGDQSLRLEAREHAAEVPRVDTERATHLSHLTLVDLGELEQHPSLGQRVRRLDDTVVEHADHARVEPVEGAYVVDRVMRACGRGHVSPLAYR